MRLLCQGASSTTGGALLAASVGEAVVPAFALAPARPEIAKLQRVLGKKTLENEILKEAVECAAEKSGLRDQPCCWGTPNDRRLPSARAGTLDHFIHGTHQYRTT